MQVFYAEHDFWDVKTYDNKTKTLYINARDGYKHTMELFEKYSNGKVINRLYTNCVWLLNCSEDNDVWIFHDEKRDYIPINELTDKEIRKSHNIEMMYRNGAFDYELEVDKR